MCPKNLRPNKHLIVGLTVSTAIALVALVVATASQAAQIGHFAAGPRRPHDDANAELQRRRRNFRSEPRFQRFNKHQQSRHGWRQG